MSADKSSPITVFFLAVYKKPTRQNEPTIPNGIIL